jgi:oligosaccharyltransferase complex subunit delta (ribophorin II)
MAKPPSSLPPSGDAPLHVSLLLGSFVHSPVTLDLFDLHVPPSAPAPLHPEEVFYLPRPELAHTFRPDPKLPPRPISALFAALVLAPWAVLFVLVRCPQSLTWFRFCPLLMILSWLYS